MRYTLAFILFIAFPVLADSLPPKEVPGAVNPDVTQANIQRTICVSGYTKTIRPKASYTNKLKLQQMKQFHLSGSPKDFEEDHLISLEIGGHPTDPKNLWPEPWEGTYGARKKDACENKLHKMVCNGQISLKAAQYYISHNWIKSCSALK